jgi:hypothetical protein
LILSSGLYANNLFTRSIASLLMVAHSSSSVLNFPYLTLYVICTSLAPLNGG